MSVTAIPSPQGSQSVSSILLFDIYPTVIRIILILVHLLRTHRHIAPSSNTPMAQTRPYDGNRHLGKYQHSISSLLTAPLDDITRHPPHCNFRIRVFACSEALSRLWSLRIPPPPPAKCSTTVSLGCNDNSLNYHPQGSTIASVSASNPRGSTSYR
jgi:hypothetical protein